MEPTDRSITANGIRLHLRDWAGPDSAPPILLVHGLASNARIWDLVAPRLAAAHRVVALDQRGHGGSEKPSSGYDFATVSADLAQAIGALGFRRPLVVGHSWGAAVALQLAADGAAPLAGIALVDGGTFEFASSMAREEAVVRLTPPRLSGTPRAAFIERLRGGWLREIWSPAAEAAVLGNFWVDAEDCLHPNLSFENHMQVVEAMVDQRPTDLYPRVACPALIIPAAPEHPQGDAAEWLRQKRLSVARAEQLLPRAQVAWAERSVHDVPLHRPEFLADTLAAFARSLAG